MQSKIWSRVEIPMVTKVQSWYAFPMSRLLKFLAIMIVGSGVAAVGQVVVISGQVNYQGSAVPYAPIRICAVTSTGTPCVPVSSIYYDYLLSNHAPNPTAADQYGNYTLYAPTIPAPGFYVAQVTPQQGITWSYVYNGLNGTGTVNAGTAGQVAYYPANGTTLNGETSVPVTAGGTGATTAPAALTNLGAEPALGNPGTNGYVLSSTTSESLVFVAPVFFSRRAWAAPEWTPVPIAAATWCSRF